MASFYERLTQPLKDLARSAKSSVGGVFQGAKNEMSMMGSGALDAMDTAGYSVFRGVDSARDGAGQVVSGAANLGRNVKKGIGATARATTETVSMAGSGMRDLVDDAGYKVFKGADAAKDSVNSVVRGAGNKARAGWRVTTGNVGMAGSAALDAVDDAGLKVFNRFHATKDGMNRIVGGTVDLGRSAKNKIGGVFRSTKNGLGMVGSGALDLVDDAGLRVFKGVHATKDGVNSVLRGAGNKARNGWRATAETVSMAGSGMRDVVEDVGLKIFNGAHAIKDGMGRMGSGAKVMAGGIANNMGRAWQGAKNRIAPILGPGLAFGWKAAKATSVAGLILGGITVAGMLVAGARNQAARRGERIPDSQAMQPLPGVLDFSNQMAQPETLMGMQPVEGEMAQRVLMSRGQAPNVNVVANPNIEQGGQSVIDGRAVESLNVPGRA